MWFKQMQCFTFEGFKAPEDWQSALESLILQTPTGARDTSMGWVSPFGLTSESLYHKYGHFVMLKAAMLQRMLPASVIKQAVDEHVAEVKREQDRDLSAREKVRIREQIKFELMPKAFCRRKEVCLLINLNSGWVVADTSNHDFAEQAIGLLHECLGSFPTNRIRKDGMTGIMTAWLREKSIKTGYTLDQDCNLVNSQDRRNSIRISCQELESDEVAVHLAAGKQVTKLGLNWSGHLGFVLDDQLTLSKIRHLDIEAESDSSGQSPEEKFDADFALLAPYYQQFVEGLFNLLEIDKNAAKEEASKESQPETAA
ncbi:MAG TPA: recombination-associated protein RdgC [Gammaproteobacteria bacterium]|nr:recombination-associated protein RdgC [Gammaproteobacteria bacterium]